MTDWTKPQGDLVERRLDLRAGDVVEFQEPNDALVRRGVVVRPGNEDLRVSSWGHIPELATVTLVHRPTIPEPTGLGAVAIVAGERFVRATGGNLLPWYGGSTGWANWGKIVGRGPVAVLSPGVEVEK